MRQSRKILSACMALALCLTPLGAGADAAPQASSYNPTVGIWYSTWYAKEGPYLWIDGHGYGSVGQFLEDVNGDGKDDAVICFENGDWYVALSTGAGFGGYSRWGAGHGSGAAKRLMGDVNGDGKADAIAYFGDGDWYVALSTGSGFGGASRWLSGLGVGSANQFIADVNGDGKEDAVIFNASGSWYASLSNGSGFNNYSQWTDGHGYGSNSQFLEDVDGDGRADAIVFFSGDGSWYVSTSRGGDFSGYSRWLLGFGAGSQKQLFADVNGDGKKDAVFFSTTGVTGSDWSWAKSLGNAFQDSGVWKYRHGYGSTNQLAGDIYGDGTDAPVAFLGDTGAWKALPANLYYVFPNIYNTWEAGFKNNNRPISYKPRTGGVYQTYDSGDPAVIDEHLAMIADAGIDYLLFDLTNHVNADNAYIKNRAKAVAERIRIWNQDSAHRKIRYAVGIGGIQMTHSPSTVEEECTIIYDEFFSQSIGGDNYYQINGKPLIVTYAEYADRLGWEQSAISKTSSNRFTVEWMQGTLTGTNASGQPPLADIGRYYGWTYPNGSIASTGTMVAQPGHNNYVGTFISRQYNGVNGGFYSTQCWQRILQQKPQNVVINSFNEFAEETAVQPSDTAGLTSPSEKWYNQNGQLDPDMYWNMTKQYIAQLRQ